MPTIYEDSNGNKFVWDENSGEMVPYFWSKYTPAAQGQEDANKALVESMTPGEQALVAAGREFTKLGRGIRGWFASPEEQAKLDAQKAQEDAIWEQGMGKYGDPIATFMGQAAPYLSTVPASLTAAGVRAGLAKFAPQLAETLGKNLVPKMLLPEAVPAANKASRAWNTVKQAINAPATKAAATGAVLGAAHEDSSAPVGAALSLTGYGIGKGLTEPLSRSQSGLNKTEKEVVKWAIKKGFKLPPGMKTGNIGLQEIDQALRTKVGTGNIMEDYARNNQRLANQIAAEKIGLGKVDSLDPVSLSSARKSLSDKMSELTKNTNGYMTIDDQVKMYHDIWEFGQNKFNKEAADIMKAQLDDVMKKGVHDAPGLKGGVRFDGQSYNKINKIMRNIQNSNYKPGGNPELARLAGRIKDTFDDAVERGMKLDKAKSGVAKEWRDVRAKYRFLNDVENSMSKEGSSGNVNLQELYRNYMKHDRRRMLEGKMFDKDVEMLAKLGNLQSRQRGASLGASQMLGNMLKGNNLGANAMGLLSQKNFRIPLLDELAVRTYYSGWPVTTGLLGLPASLPPSAGKVMSRVGLGAMSDVK